MGKPGTGFFMPRSADDIARLQEATCSASSCHSNKSSGSPCPSDPHRDLGIWETPQGLYVCPQQHKAAISSSTPAAMAGSSCGRTNSTRQLSPAAISRQIPAKHSTSSPAASALPFGPRAVCPGLRAGPGTASCRPWHSAFAGNGELFSSAKGQSRPTPAAEAPSMQPTQSPDAGWDLGWADQLAHVIRVGEGAGDSSSHDSSHTGSYASSYGGSYGGSYAGSYGSSYAGSSPSSSGLLPAVSLQSSCAGAAPGGCNPDHLSGTIWTHNTLAGQGHNSAAGLADALIPTFGNLPPTTATGTPSGAMLASAPAQQQQTAWGSPADLNTLLHSTVQLQLGLAAEHGEAATMSGPVEVYSSVGRIVSSGSLLGMYSTAPGLVLQSGSFNTLLQQQQQCPPDGVLPHSLSLPFNSSTAQTQAHANMQLAPSLELDSLTGCGVGSAPLPESNSLLAALHGSSSVGCSLTQQHLVGNGVAAAAAAVAQDKLAHLQQLEMLQQQLRNEVLNLLPLI